MSTPQYLRKASLLIGDDKEALDLSQLRFRFAIHRGDSKTPNSADIRVYNLSDETCQKIQKEFTRVVLQAGYEENFGLIFDGTTVQFRRGRESQTDTYLDITAADGDRAYNFAVMNMSLAAGASVDDQIAAIIQSMVPHGVTLGYKPPALTGNTLPRGKTYFGAAKTYLDDLVKTISAKWSIQDGKVEIIPLDAYIPGEIPAVTAATGMVGLPEQTQNGIKVRMLLNPAIRIGRLIQLDNASIQEQRYGVSAENLKANNIAARQGKKDNNGRYYIMVAEHSGDTRGNEWYTDVICLATDASVPLALVDKASAISPIKAFG
ncbi:phage protein [Silvimonas soli]|uniref:phage protein n=1 Tax=Silvimonas soli TaxID=2980100 RepID=UPI0024B3B24A|nr:hypothetical protein [Silvimonas soli]